MRPTAAEATEAGSYRSDIDGLRAIAVLSVILFHINKSVLPGGFVGVDIFFVISGYLISSGILRGLSAGRFSLLDFYRRRVKRIAPAMLVVIAVVLVVSQTILRPEDAEKAARSAFWSVLSVGNVYFWKSADTSYFAASSAEAPLLHLWSLGVEEQFYVLWPLGLMIARRYLAAAWFPWLVAGVALMSVGAAEWLSQLRPDFSYYMLPTRAGELLVGALVATRLGKTVGTVARANQIAWLGVILIAGSLALIHEGMVFPGWRSLPPTLGAAAMIWAGGVPNSASRALSMKPLVWVGLVSYSAYLWHWPLLAFYRYGHATIDWAPGLALLVSTFLLAWLSWRFVERPGRHVSLSAKGVIGVLYVMPAVVIAGAAFWCMSMKGWALHGLDSMYASKLRDSRVETRAATDFAYICQRPRLQQADVENPECVTGSRNGDAPQVVLWGDSHASHYVGVISSFAEKEDFNVRNFAVGSCPPVFADAEPYATARRLDDCRKSLAVVRKAIDRFSIVIIGGDWVNYQSNSQSFLDALEETVVTLVNSGKRVILLGDIPRISGLDRLCEEKSIAYPALKCSPFRVPMDATVAVINGRLKAMAQRHSGVSYFDVVDQLCEGGTCSAFDRDGARRYYDSAHLSLVGSWGVGRRLLAEHGTPEVFRGLVKR